MSTTKKLFSEFKPVSREQWKAKATEDLKGAEFDKKLVWKTDDGFAIQPFYTREDLNENEYLKEQHKVLVGGNRTWINYSLVQVQDVAQANALAVEMLSFGATGILFEFNKTLTVDFEVLLKNLDPEQLQISFSTPTPSLTFLVEYFAFLTKKNIKTEIIKGFYEADVLEQWMTEGAEPHFDVLYQLLEAGKTAPHFKTLVIRSHAFVNSGSSTTQEIAFTLNKLTEYFEKLQSRGLKAEAIAQALLLHMAIAGDYFFEIAKLRAVRILLKGILKLYNCDVPVTILSSNSTWSKSFYDANVNMLRNTTEAMSAVLGGCDALLTYPHDYSYRQPSPFSQRVALNISNLLREESYFDKVVDPSGGSYYIEALTGSLADHALQLFKEIENNQGFIEAFRAGIIQQKIGAVRDKKEKEIALRRRVYVGTNKHPNPSERTTLKEAKTEEKQGELQLLHAQRATRSFEELRTKTLKYFDETGFIPTVYLACFGNLALIKARATFSIEFFASAGFEILGEYLFTDIQKAAHESAASKANIVVICSSDSDYATSAKAFAEIFKSLSKDKLLVLAGYPETIVEQLQQAGVDSFIHIKSNAIEVLSGLQRKLFINS
jgi:methylmalonyl-CoA mutase